MAPEQTTPAAASPAAAVFAPSPAAANQQTTPVGSFHAQAPIAGSIEPATNFPPSHLSAGTFPSSSTQMPMRFIPLASVSLSSLPTPGRVDVSNPATPMAPTLGISTPPDRAAPPSKNYHNCFLDYPLASQYLLMPSASVVGLVPPRAQPPLFVAPVNNGGLSMPRPSSAFAPTGPRTVVGIAQNNSSSAMINAVDSRNVAMTGLQSFPILPAINHHEIGSTSSGSNHTGSGSFQDLLRNVSANAVAAFAEHQHCGGIESLKSTVTADVSCVGTQVGSFAVPVFRQSVQCKSPQNGIGSLSETPPSTNSCLGSFYAPSTCAARRKRRCRSKVIECVDYDEDTGTEFDDSDGDTIYYQETPDHDAILSTDPEGNDGQVNVDYDSETERETDVERDCPLPPDLTPETDRDVEDGMTSDCDDESSDTVSDDVVPTPTANGPSGAIDLSFELYSKLPADGSTVSISGQRSYNKRVMICWWPLKDGTRSRTSLI